MPARSGFCREPRAWSLICSRRRRSTSAGVIPRGAQFEGGRSPSVALFTFTSAERSMMRAAPKNRYSPTGNSKTTLFGSLASASSNHRASAIPSPSASAYW